MAKVNYSSIVVGDGRLFVAAAADQVTADRDITTNGENSTYYAGSTQEGVNISWEPDMVDIEVDQFGDAARVVVSKIKVMVKTTLAEGTLLNLARVWNYPTSGATTTTAGRSADGTGQGGASEFINLGIAPTYPQERWIRIQGTAPGTTASTTIYRTYRNSRCISYSSSEHSLQRADNVKFSVEFRVLPDTQFTGKEYGYIVDSTLIPYSTYTV